MKNGKWKTLKRIIALIVAVAIAGGLAIMPVLTKNSADDSSNVTILSGTVGTNTINTEVIGGGTLEAEASETLSVPSSVKLTSYLVSNGDTVSEGDPIASVDRITVMTAISDVQEKLDEIDEQLEDECDSDTETKITTDAGGTVKIIYGETGDSVQDVMLQYGSLAVLSLDNKMAVEITTDSDLSSGSSVTVISEDGTEAEGRVESNLAGDMVVTFDDNNYEIGQTVTVSDNAGDNIGSGELYVYSAWNASAYTGTIKSVDISVGDEVDAGSTVITLTNSGKSAEYQSLLNQREKYEELMMTLFEMYQTETVCAPCDGVVSGLDDDSILLLSSASEESEFTLLSNSPDGNDEATYSNYVGKVTAVGTNGWAMTINPQSIQIEDYMNLSGIQTDENSMIEVITYNPNQEGTSTPIYELQNNAWVQLNPNEIKAGDALVLASDSTGNYVWIVRIQSENSGGEIPSDAGNEGFPGENDMSENTTVPSEFPSGATESETQSVPDMSGDFSAAAGEAAVTDFTGNAGEETEADLLDMTSFAEVTPQETVSIDIDVNELDINKLRVGMEAEVKINVLTGEKYSAVISEISNDGTNNGGYSYYTVKLVMNREPDMLDGMNTTVTIITETAENVISIPAEALAEEGTATVVYTGYDEENNELINPVEVTTGVSDGQEVEINDGLSEGQIYYYSYYDKAEESMTVID